jgi:3-oxoacyl-[acyl-carrier-protein] synthase II
MVAGEGAAVLVLEDREAATARGAKIYAEVLGQGSSLVADSTLGGRQQAAMSQAMRAALEDAKLAPSDIGHINTHGLATRESDSHEAAALADVFGDHARRVPVTALKSYFGNLGAGGGAAELIGSLLAAEAEQMAPTCGFAEADSDCPLRVATAAEPCPPATKLLKLSVTPQGQAAAIVLSLGG